MANDMREIIHFALDVISVEKQDGVLIRTRYYELACGLPVHGETLTTRKADVTCNVCLNLLEG